MSWLSILGNSVPKGLRVLMQTSGMHTQQPGPRRDCALLSLDLGRSTKRCVHGRHHVPRSTYWDS